MAVKLRWARCTAGGNGSFRHALPAGALPAAGAGKQPSQAHCTESPLLLLRIRPPHTLSAVCLQEAEKQAAKDAKLQEKAAKKVTAGAVLAPAVGLNQLWYPVTCCVSWCVLPYAACLLVPQEVLVL